MPKDPSAIQTGTGLHPGPADDIFAPIDLHFARFMMHLSNSKKRELALAAAIVSRLGREGHTCLDLSSPLGSVSTEDASGTDMDLPDAGAWITALREEPVVGAPGEYRPLVLDSEGRLYLHRAFMEERTLAEKLLRMNTQSRGLDENRLRESMSRFFPEAEPPQKIAALMAAARSLCVITGGPGTGKTTLVCRVLALLLDLEPDLKIALAAPTGKAARRIAESIQAGIERLDCPAGLKDKIPHEASTMHRLLGFSAGSTRPRHCTGNPLSADVVVIDEASMADLALMANLVEALKEGARLILLGDRNQLASVAAGYVLGDICDTGRVHAYSTDFADLVERVAGCRPTSGGRPGMPDSLVELTKTYRFRQDSPIYTLSAAVNEGDAAISLEILRSCSGGGLRALGLPRPEALRKELRDAIMSGYESFLSSSDPSECLHLFDAFRVLCPVREGPYGVKAMNRLIQDILAASGLLEPVGLHFSGRPILVTENDYSLRLFNGDTGIVMKDEGGELRACFQDKNGTVRMISPMRLPAHETAFAMTVHKSQGSEFDRVMLVLPDRDSPVLTRELIYTAITRARMAIEIRTDKDVFTRSVERRTLRSSGLNDLLWGPRRA